ncbi:MAG: sirohydrochlorin chelatase [Ornithinimicrobium sp.]
MSPTPAPLVLLAHGTADERGQAVVYGVAEAVSRRLPATEVVVGFVDVCTPGADEALARQSDTRAVVVPYLLTTGYHVRHDIPAAVERRGGDVGLTPALGVTPEVVQALCDRWAEAVTGPGGVGGDQIDAVVVAGAGSSDAGARREVMCLAALVAASLSLPTRAGFLSGAGPSAASCVSELRRSGAQGVAVLPALLAPGFFVAKAGRLGADVVAPALGVHSALVDLVVRRYREAS